jgi:type II secretory pathway component PulF
MDPLANLKDIALSDPIHDLPVAIGWWLLLALVLIIVVVLFRKLQKRKAAHKQKNEALKQLETQQESTSQMLNTLKWAVLAYYPREQVASLHGENYITFLKTQLKANEQGEFVKSITPAIESLYKPNDEIDKAIVYRAISSWIKSSLPPKQGGQRD